MRRETRAPCRPMSTVAPDASDPPAPPPESAWKEFARAPLVPVALAATAGLVTDRYGQLALNVSLLVAAVGLIGWLVARVRSPDSALVWLWLTAAPLAAAHHHAHRHLFAPDD